MGAREETIRISLFFFFLFTPFSSYMTILTHIYEQADLPGIGPATLASNYITFIISTIVAPAVRFPLKLQLLFGGVFYTFNYSSGIFAAMTDQAGLKFTISCLGSALAGCSAGFLWVSQGRYIHLVCQKFGILPRKGQMYGIFSSLYCFSNVSAGLITTFALGFFDPQIYFLIITILGVLATLFCLFFVRHITEDEAKQSLLSSLHQNVDNNEQGTSKDLEDNKGNPVQVTTLPDPDKYSMVQVIKGTVKFIPQMYAVLLFLVIDGIALGVYSSEITHLIPPDIEKDMVNKIAGVTMIILGVGSTIGGYAVGFIADRVGGLKAGRLGLMLFVCSCGVFLAAYRWPQLWLTFIAGFLWGFSLFYIEGWMFITCSRYYEGKAEAFSVNKQLHSLFYLIFQIVVFSTDNNLPIYPLIAGTAALTIPAFFMLNKLPLQK